MAILKKTYLSSLLPSFLIPIALTSCYEEFEPDVDTKPVLCINSLITAGSPIEVNVSHTWRYTDFAGMKNHEVKDAKVTLTVNGNRVEEGHVALEGDHIRIDASSPTYGEAWAEVTVPHAADVTGVRFQPHITAATSDAVHMNVNIEIDLQDPEGVNFYQYECSGYGQKYDEDGYVDEWGWWHEPMEYDSFDIGKLDDRAEPLFREHMDIFESAMEDEAGGFVFFTDRQFDGKSYTVHMNFRDASLMIPSEGLDESWLDCGYDICINGVSESWYKWQYYDWQTGWMSIGDLAEAGLGDAVWGYSNVSTGAGIVAARTLRHVRVSLRDFLLQTLPDAFPKE